MATRLSVLISAATENAMFAAAGVIVGAAVAWWLSRHIGKKSGAEKRLREQAEQIQSQWTAAHTDQLTNLANRRRFEEELLACFNTWNQRGTPFSVMLLDVDHFKTINDSHGHQTGDQVLRSVARILKSALRVQDLVARYGGEEFAVIFPKTHLKDAALAAERARQAISSSEDQIAGTQIAVTISTGLNESRAGSTVQQIVKDADAALYASKQAGRNCTHYFDGNRYAPYHQSAGADQPK